MHRPDHGQVQSVTLSPLQGPRPAGSLPSLMASHFWAHSTESQALSSATCSTEAHSGRDEGVPMQLGSILESDDDPAEALGGAGMAQRFPGEVGMC